MKTIREALEAEFRQGKLDYIRDDLKRFLSEQRGTIDRLLAQDLAGLKGGITRIIRGKKVFNQEARFDLAVRLLIKQARTINPALDIRLQITEVAREVWLEGERLHRPCTRQDENRIAKEWNEKYGQRFRDWLLLRVLYVFDRYHQEFVELFRASNEEPSARERENGESAAKKGSKDSA